MLYGQTERAGPKNPVQTRQWDETSILAEIKSRHGAEARRIAQQIIDWIKSEPGQIKYGQGGKDGSIGLRVTVIGLESTPIVLYTYYGQVEVRLQFLKRPFDDPAKREELRQKLNEIEGVNLPSGKQRPNIPIATFANNDEKLKRFLDVMHWCVSELRSA
jgi:hypothetical protein